MKVLRMQTGVVVHPNHPEIKIYVKKRPKIKQLRQFEEVFDKQDIQVLVHPVTMEVLRNTKGEIETTTRTSMPVDMIISDLMELCTGWEGVEDENGPVSFHQENFDILFEPEFDVKSKNAETGEEENKPFWAYINEQINDGKAFEKNPIGSAI